MTEAVSIAGNKETHKVDDDSLTDSTRLKKHGQKILSILVVITIAALIVICVIYGIREANSNKCMFH